MHSRSRPVDRFFQTLLEELEASGASQGDQLFTVAEIYQSLIPYRTHRDRLGVEMNGDYEDTLLRLLAGEGDFLTLESEAARTRIRQELSQSNPNTGIYREFAAVGVRINPDRSPALTTVKAAAPSKPAPLQTTLESLEPATPRNPSVAEEPSGTASGALGVSAKLKKSPVPPQEIRSDLSSGERPCPDCGKDLPNRDSLRFCPHCGTNVIQAPCRECGEVLERSWKFCLACGTSTH